MNEKKTWNQEYDERKDKEAKYFVFFFVPIFIIMWIIMMFV